MLLWLWAEEEVVMAEQTAEEQNEKMLRSGDLLPCRLFGYC